MGNYTLNDKGLLTVTSDPRYSHTSDLESALKRCPTPPKFVLRLGQAFTGIFNLLRIEAIGRRRISGRFGRSDLYLVGF